MSIKNAKLLTTLNRIRAHGPCTDSWNKLLRGLGKPRADDEPLKYSKIVRPPTLIGTIKISAFQQITNFLSGFQGT